MKTLSVFCSSKNNLSTNYKKSTFDLINCLDLQKYQIAYGGGTTGLMGIVRSTWLDKGGILISSNVIKFTEPTIIDTYVYDNLIDRQKKLVELGDAYLILPGGYGTHYEMLEVVTKNDVKEANKPIFILNVNGIFDKFIEHIQQLISDGFITHDLNELNIHISSSSVELVKKIEQIII